MGEHSPQTSGSTGTLERALQSPPDRKARRTSTRHRSTTIKVGKAPGQDNIPPEVSNADPATSARMMQGLLQDIWEKEEIPTEWKTGHIVKLPKEGDLGDCHIWRGKYSFYLSLILILILTCFVNTGPGLPKHALNI